MEEWSSTTRMTKEEASVACRIEKDIQEWVKECGDTGEPVRWAKVGVEEVGVVCAPEREYWQVVLFGCYANCPRLFRFVKDRVRERYLMNDPREIVVTGSW